MLGLTTKPMWEQVAALHSDWANSRPSGQSMALSAFLKHLSDALQIGLVEVQVCGDRPAVQTGDQIVVGECNLAGNLDALRSTLKAAEVQVGGLVHG